MPTKCILAEQGGKGGGGGAGLTLIKLEVTHPPTKIDYIAEEKFEPSGMIVTATYGVGETVIATGEVTGYKCSPEYVDDDTEEITVTYSEMGSTQTATTPVHVTHKVKSIEVTTPPDKQTYKYHETFSPTGMKITAIYSDGAREEKEQGFTCSPLTRFESLGQQTITVSYTEATYTVICEYNEITVERADGNLVVDKERVTVRDKDPQIITVTRLGDGEISYSPLSIEGVTIRKEDNKIIITGDGETAFDDTQLTISVAEGTFYTAPESKIVTINAIYWEWGQQDQVGDEAWWEGLKKSLSSGDHSQYVGWKKKVKLSTAVRGWNKDAEVSMICIGYDIDADNTLTFETEGTSPTNSTFGNSATWHTSTAKTDCETFAMNCSATASIKEVTKLTCTVQNNLQTNDADGQTTVHGFLLSDCEHGFLSGADYNNGKGYSSSYKEYTLNGQQTAYQYFTGNEQRIKRQCSSNGQIGSSTQIYWERSRGYNDSVGVCGVRGDGKPSYGDYDNSGGLAPAFVIG